MQDEPVHWSVPISVMCSCVFELLLALVSQKSVQEHLPAVIVLELSASLNGIALLDWIGRRDSVGGKFVRRKYLLSVTWKNQKRQRRNMRNENSGRTPVMQSIATLLLS
jgi:hypothetical protein